MESIECVKPKISVIVPAYNVEKYLDACLDSVLLNMQNFADGEVEVILVNDGSTDDTETICEKYVESCRNIRLYTQKNAGLSAARNTALECVAGDYIFFLDSDDMLKPDALLQLYLFSEENNCEVTQGGMLYFFGDERDYVASDVTGVRQNTVFKGCEAMRLLIENDIVKNFACGKLYKSDVVKGITFPVGQYFEDMCWQQEIVGRCRRYGLLNKPLYIYRQREDSISCMFSLRKLDLLKGYEGRLAYVEENFPELTAMVARRFWQSIVDIENNMSRSRIDEEDKVKATAFLVQEKTRYAKVFDNYLLHDVAYRMYCISPCMAWLYGCMVRICNRIKLLLNG